MTDYTTLAERLLADVATTQAAVTDIQESGVSSTWHPPIMLGGEFLIDPGEINGWGVRGRLDDRHTNDLGNAGATNLATSTGGVVLPYDVRVKRLLVHHTNSNANAAISWAWVLAKQTWSGGSATRTTTYVLDQVTATGAAGYNNYATTIRQLTDIDLSGNAENVVPAGDMLTLGVAGASTTPSTNYYVRCHAGFIELERI